MNGFEREKLRGSAIAVDFDVVAAAVVVLADERQSNPVAIAVSQHSGPPDLVWTAEAVPETASLKEAAEKLKNVPEAVVAVKVVVVAVRIVVVVVVVAAAAAAAAALVEIMPTKGCSGQRPKWSGEGLQHQLVPTADFVTCHCAAG